MNILSLLQNRSSQSKLSLPLPSEEQLSEIFKSVLSAPDHAGLKPWKYLVYQGESSLKQLGKSFIAAKLKANLELTEEQVDRTASLPLRAPMVIVAVAKLVAHPKVPEWEQIVSVGCGVHSMLLALESLGFAGYWRTGDLSENPFLLDELGLDPSDKIVGFLYVGTPAIMIKKERTAELSRFFEFK